MNIFEGLQFCFDNPNKGIAFNEKTCFYYSRCDGNFYEEITGKLSIEDFDINEWPFNGEYKPVIEKQPLNELFSFWIDGGVVCCEINGKEWIIDKCYFKALSGDDDRMHVTPELAKQPIWWVKE